MNLENDNTLKDDSWLEWLHDLDAIDTVYSDVSGRKTTFASHALPSDSTERFPTLVPDRPWPDTHLSSLSMESNSHDHVSYHEDHGLNAPPWPVGLALPTVAVQYTAAISTSNDVGPHTHASTTRDPAPILKTSTNYRRRRSARSMYASSEGEWISDYSGYSGVSLSSARFADDEVFLENQGKNKRPMFMIGASSGDDSDRSAAPKSPSAGILKLVLGPEDEDRDSSHWGDSENESGKGYRSRVVESIPYAQRTTQANDTPQRNSFSVLPLETDFTPFSHSDQPIHQNNADVCAKTHGLPCHSAKCCAIQKALPSQQIAERLGGVLSETCETGFPAELDLTDNVVLEDSDNSWTQADNDEGWHQKLQEQLGVFRVQDTRISLVTSTLNTQQRRQVHALAQLLQLSHMSIGCGKLKRILIMKCEVAQLPQHAHSGRWNPVRGYWSSGWADPRIIKIQHLSVDLTVFRLRTILEEMKLSAPSLSEMATEGREQTAYLFFDDAKDAAETIVAFDNILPVWNPHVTQCEYLRLPGHSRAINENNLNLQKLGRSANHMLQAEREYLDSFDAGTSLGHSKRSASLKRMAPSLVDQAISEEAIKESRIPAVEEVTFNNALETNLSAVSLASQFLSDATSEASAYKKQKRLPAIPGGYCCSTCGKAFDRAGDCRKHEESHSTLKNKYPCSMCDEWFRYPKDVRRHVEDIHNKPGRRDTGAELRTHGTVANSQGTHICECCPKKPKRFDTIEELRIHKSEKQYCCAYCPNRFKNLNEAERHQNSLHLRRHNWTCAVLTEIEAAFHASRAMNTDMCGYCGEEYPNPPQWDTRTEHLNHAHKFGECQGKKFFRADHFRQHLKHSHAATFGKWTNLLESTCMRDEPLLEKRAVIGPLDLQ